MGPDVRLDELDRTPNQVPGFTSVSNDIIIQVNSLDGSHLITDDVYNWTSFFVFDLQSDTFIQEFMIKPNRVQSVFSEGSKLLNQFLRGELLALIGLNVSIYLLQDLTALYIDSLFTLLNENNFTEAFNKLKQQRANLVSDTLRTVPYARFFEKEGEDLLRNIDLLIPSTYNISSEKDEFKANLHAQILDTPTLLVQGLSYSSLANFFIPVLETFAFSSPLSSEAYFSFAAKLLIQSNNPDDITFLAELYGTGQLTNYVEMGAEKLLPFLNADFLPAGFNRTLQTLYLESFTNYDSLGDTDRNITSMIVKLSLRPEISEQNITTILQYMEERIHNETKSNMMNLELVVVNQLNYQLELSDTFEDNFEFLDLVTVIIGLLILMITIRRPGLVFLNISVAWLSSITIRGIVVLLLPESSSLRSGNLSLVNAILFGAAINYTVFFSIRYLEELKENSEKDAIRKSVETAVHSIVISGLAVFITVLPLTYTKYNILRGVVWGVSAGILLQLIFMVFFLPATFSLFARLTKYQIPKVLKSRTPAFAFPRARKDNVRRLLIITGIISLLSILVLIHAPGQIVASDLISSDSNTYTAFSTFEQDYSETYFSKVLVELELNTSLRVSLEGDINFSKLELIGNLSAKFAAVPHVKSVLSAGWPLAGPIDYENNSRGLLEFEAAKLLAEQYISPYGNISIILIVLDIPSQSLEIRPVVGELFSIAENIDSDDILTVELTGLPVEAYGSMTELLIELPLQITVGIILLIIFLGIMLKTVTVPIRLVLTIIIGSIASLALSTILWELIFQQPLNLLVMVSVVTFLIAFGTDFDIYLYRRIVEEHEHHHTMEESIAIALDKSARAIKASGLVMVGAFFSLLVSSLPLFQQFGLVIGTAIFLDIYIVRPLVVPAFLLVFSKD